MTMFDLERVLIFYGDNETRKWTEIFKAFAIHNAQSTAVSISSCMNKNGSSILQKFMNDMKRVGTDTVEESFDFIEGQFNGK